MVLFFRSINLIFVVNFIAIPLKTLPVVHLNNEITLGGFEIYEEVLNELPRQAIKVHVVSYVSEDL